MAITRAAPQILWGTNYENVLDFPIFDNVVTGRRPRDGSVQGRTSGVQVSWVEGWDYWMKGDARWIPDQDLTTPFVATGWSGPTGWQAFLDWARTWPNTFRFVPDRTVPDFYVDGCYLTVPFEEENGNAETDGTRSVSITVQNPTIDFCQALRGIMFEYAPGMSLTDPVAATFSRASAATRRGVPGTLVSAVGASDAVNVLRDRHYEGTLRTTLLEAARTQLVTDPENFGAWSLGGTPVLTAGQADPFGGTAAYLIEDNDGAGFEEVYQVTGFTGDATKALAIFVRQGSSAFAYIGLLDNTVAAWRHLCRVTWAAGVPSLSTIAGAGTLFPVEPWGGGWYRISFSATGVVAANTNRWTLSPVNDTASETGTTYFFGANAWDATFPSSYQGPSLASRSVDSFDWPFPYAPQAMFLLCDWVDRGLVFGADGNSFAVEIGNVFQNGRLIIDSGSVDMTAFHQANAASVGQNVAGVPSFGDRVQALAILNPDGSVQLKRAFNLAAEVASGTSGPLALRAGSWNPAKIQFYGGTTLGHGLVRCKVGPLTFGGITRDTIAKALSA